MQLFHQHPGRSVIVRAAPGVALSACNAIISGLAMTIIPGASRCIAKAGNAQRRIQDREWEWSHFQLPASTGEVRVKLVEVFELDNPEGTGPTGGQSVGWFEPPQAFVSTAGG